ncbi:hypothetical protein BDV32DRAFT_132602 [Aspergillus pseudonomiae]|nr:hypothetical protein BDV32DRAFT_132602 [Aspergillus pseudonomiae]
MVFYSLYLLGVSSLRYFPSTPQLPTWFVRRSCIILYLLNIPLSTCHPRDTRSRRSQERESNNIGCLSLYRQGNNNVTDVSK